MWWAGLAFTGAFAVGAKTTLDKKIIAHMRVNYFTFALISSLIPCIVFTVAATIDGRWIGLHDRTFLLALLGNVFFVTIAELTYIRAVDHHDASAVESIKSLVPIFVGIFAFLLLGEKLSWLSGSGIALAVVGCFLLQQSRGRDGLPHSLRDSFWLLMSVHIVCTAASTSFSRLALTHGQLTVYIAMRYLAMCPIFFVLRLLLPQPHRTPGERNLRLMLGSGALLTLSDFFEFWALSLTKAAYVESVRKASILFVLVLEFLFLGRVVNRRRIVAGAILLGGVILVALGSAD